MKKYAKVKNIRKLGFGGMSNEETSAVGLGAASGALSGAAAGSVIPGWGTAVGGIVGGIAGGASAYFKSEKQQKDAAAQQLAQQQALDLQAKQDTEFKLNQQKNYTNAYNTINPVTGREGVGIYKDGGNWIQSAINPAHKGYCTPMTKSTCTGHRKALAMTFKKHHGFHKAYGGEMNTPYSMKADGGELDPLASDMTKAVGATHEQGGITLNEQGKPLVEVENQEVMKGTHVFTDRKDSGSGITYAARAEQLGKKKGKYEKAGESNNSREKNSAERMTAHIDKDLDMLFAKQESEKKPVNTSITYACYGGKMRMADGGVFPYSPYMSNQERTKVNLENRTRVDYENANNEGFDAMNQENYRNANVTGRYNPNRGTLTSEEIAVEEGGYGTPTNSGTNWANVAQKAVPYIDNLYNAYLTSKTPNIPTPSKRVALNQTAMPMQTNINVSPELNDANRSYQLLNKDINENTSNSVTARGNKLQAFASLLDNRNKVYGAKNRGETELQNQNSQNIQQVNNANTVNKQNIDNTNLGLTDNYNYAKMQRASDINAMKSQNVSNAVNDVTKQIQDSNMANLDRERISVDSLRYSDASGYARSVGEPNMDRLINTDSNAYKRIENSLIQGGQDKALDRFYTRYGKK